MALVGSWAAQEVEEFPLFWSTVVGADGLSYLVAGTDIDSMPTIVKVLADGSMTEATTNAGSVAPKSVAVAGSKIVTVGQNTGVEEAYVDVFSTLTLSSVANPSIATPGINSPRFGAGALASDGLVYFPPSRLSTSMQPLVYDPSDDSLAFTNFGGAWANAESQVYGSAAFGGDGMLYFLPGFAPFGGGGGGSGSDILRIDVEANTVTSLEVPLDPIFGSPESAFYWAYPASDGVYALSTRNGIYKVTAAGAELLAVADPWSESWSNGDQLTQTLDIGGSIVPGADGLLYCVGSTYRSSGSYTPAIMTIDPETDVVAFQEFPEMTGKPFVPIATFRMGNKIGAFSRMGDEFPDLFLATPDVPPSSGPRFYLGSVPHRAYLGSIPLKVAVG